MSKTYAIADLPGRYDLLETAFDAILSYAEGKAETIITLGDYIDRGPRSREVIELLMAVPPEHKRHLDDWRLICLRGNHEEITLETIRKPLNPEWWLRNGGGWTLISYGAKVGDRVDTSI